MIKPAKALYQIIIFDDGLFAIEGRKQVKDQPMRIDTTYGEVRFAYMDTDGKETLVTTLEEEEYPIPWLLPQNDCCTG